MSTGVFFRNCGHGEKTWQRSQGRILFFDVVYEDDSQRSNRRVPANLLVAWKRTSPHAASSSGKTARSPRNPAARRRGSRVSPARRQEEVAIRGLTPTFEVPGIQRSAPLASRCGWRCFRTCISAQGLNGVEQQRRCPTITTPSQVLGRQTRQDPLIDLFSRNAASYYERRAANPRGSMMASYRRTCPGRSHAVLSGNFRWRPVCGPARARLPRAYLPPTVRRLT